MSRSTLPCTAISFSLFRKITSVINVFVNFPSEKNLYSKHRWIPEITAKRCQLRLIKQKTIAPCASWRNRNGYEVSREYGMRLYGVHSRSRSRSSSVGARARHQDRNRRSSKVIRNDSSSIVRIRPCRSFTAIVLIPSRRFPSGV